MTPAERRTLLALTITCAVLGAVAATWFGSAPAGWRLLVVLGAALLVTPLAWWGTAHPAGHRDGHPDGHRAGPGDGNRAARSGGATVTTPEPPPARPAEPTTWWSRPTDGDSPTPAPTAPARTPEPAETAQIAQCPRCGDFRLDVHRDGPTFGFRCAGGCGHAWTWAVGTPWPPTVVRRAFDRRNRVAHAVTDYRE